MMDKSVQGAHMWVTKDLLNWYGTVDMIYYYIYAREKKELSLILHFLVAKCVIHVEQYNLKNKLVSF